MSNFELTTISDNASDPEVTELDPFIHSTRPEGRVLSTDDGHGGPPPGSANTGQVIVNIIISFVGAGLLGMPYAFSKSGWLLGGITLLIVSAANVYAMLCLPAVQRALMERKDQSLAGNPLGSYGDIGRAILGPKGEILVHICLGISQAGFATAYIIFIAANLYSIAKVPISTTSILCNFSSHIQNLKNRNRSPNTVFFYCERIFFAITKTCYY